MEAGTLARVLHDFLTTVDGELSLCKGEYFLVHRVTDKHWCYGQSHDRTGKFPLGHLHKVDTPQVPDSQCLFVSIARFSGEQDGDLSFGRGEIIAGIREVGTGWYLGQIDSRRGIFPTTHAWQLDGALLKKSTGKKSVRRKAKVKATLKAQLDEELDLSEGQIVVVTEILDDGWCRGETDDGREGTFPEGFVTYVDDNVTDQTDTPLSMEHDAPPMPVPREDPIYKDFGESAYEVPHPEEPAPNYYDLFPEYSTASASEPTDPHSDGNLNSYDLKPYAMTLYPFNAQFPNELSFGVGEVVHLIKYIDSEWIEGSIDCATGIFPVSYVNIIVDCPEIRENQALQDQQISHAAQGTLEPGSLAKVEYTFKAQMSGDLSVFEGDIVTVVEMTNEDWVNVKNKNGEIGLCPRGYLNPVFDYTDPTESLLEDFVIVRKENTITAGNGEQKPKRLSEPHRPAPPAPAPGRVPLQKEAVANETASPESIRQDNKNLSSDLVNNRQRNADQRQNVISELVLTEKEYVRDLKLTYETFHLHNPTFLESKGIDVATLFGNLLEVIHVAEELLDTILRAMKGREEELQRIGPCFLKMADKMQTVYVKYCGNHEAALALLTKYENNEEIMTVFNKGIETLRYQVACFDMSSILIKPVQRILKYPLILNELIKCTEEDHVDRLAIEEARKAMTDVASYINEYKRRKDIVSKYLDNDNTLMRKMAKLNMHSVAKMSTRLSTRLSATLGLTNIATDQEFEELERQFRSVEKCTLQLAKDAEQCLAYLHEEALSGELIADFLIQYYQGTANEEVKKLRDIRSVVRTHFVQDMKTCIEKRVSCPVDFLATLLHGPAVLITKRHDKLLDYDAAISKGEKSRESRIAQEELLTAKSNYEALNQQLLEELPILIDAATKVLINCINAFANARKLLYGKITKQYLTLCETTVQSPAHDVLESFLVNHNLLWNQITRFSFAGTNPRIEEQQTKWCPQSERQRISLRNKYAKDKLYVVTENIVSTTSLDMGAGVGTLVAVIKKQDPMGDATRWYVDNGVAQGFLPSHKLQPFQQSPQIERTVKESITNRSSTPDLMSLDSPEKEVKPPSESNLQALMYLNIDEELKINNYGNIERTASVSQQRTENYQTPDASQYRNLNYNSTGVLQYQNLNYKAPVVPQYQNLSYQFYYVMYDFEGQFPGTLPVVKGQAVRLVRPHDEKGNSEWWLMEDRNHKQGYVPRNYLNPSSLTH